jgi:hypothetical protein
MKKLLVLVAVLIMAAIPSTSQTSAYMIDYFSNNPGPGGAADQQIRLVNFAAQGTPLTSPVGDVCANVYVFDANQELVACCSCRVTPNGLLSLSLANGLTNNPVTSVVPVNGDVKIVSTAALGAAACTPLTNNGGILNSTVGFGTHLQTSGGSAAGAFITETPLATLPVEVVSNGPEGPFLLQACQFARYLGSSKGVCSCK